MVRQEATAQNPWHYFKNPVITGGRKRSNLLKDSVGTGSATSHSTILRFPLKQYSQELRIWVFCFGAIGWASDTIYSGTKMEGFCKHYLQKLSKP